MDRVGGYQAFRELEQDTRAYDDVLIVIEGEHDAEVVIKLKAEAAGAG